MKKGWKIFWTVIISLTVSRHQKGQGPVAPARERGLK